MRPLMPWEVLELGLDWLAAAAMVLAAVYALGVVLMASEWLLTRSVRLVQLWRAGR